MIITFTGWCFSGLHGDIESASPFLRLDTLLRIIRSRTIPLLIICKVESAPAGLVDCGSFLRVRVHDEVVHILPATKVGFLQILYLIHNNLYKVLTLLPLLRRLHGVAPYVPYIAPQVLALVMRERHVFVFDNGVVIMPVVLVALYL